ncbi:mRNA capping enzyme [Gigaspora margarita]|uniref:mRNA-capping enzyme subunit beta n=1 Tax=Gigaspora margarita TaxID=4874 RepID=A0A8H4ANP5_GIGMA|nr:mRNA capping enzyme [Gigaspora margarita]
MASNEKLGYHSQNEGDTGSDPSTSNIDDSVVRHKSTRYYLPKILEPSIFGFQPTSDITRAVGDFLYNHIGKENVEIEAKLGILVDKNQHTRVNLPVVSETVINPREDGWFIFQSDMTTAQHRNFNNLLNERVIQTKPPYKGNPVEYKHLYETDRFYSGTGVGKVRVTIDQKTNKVIDGGIVKKTNVAHLNIYSPNTHLDYRISVNIEKPMEMPNGQVVYERNKDRLSYIHQLFKIDLTQVRGPEKQKLSNGTQPPADLTHELEVEFLNPQVLLEEKLKFEKQQSHRYLDIIDVFLNNIRTLAQRSLPPQ